MKCCIFASWLFRRTKWLIKEDVVPLLTPFRNAHIKRMPMPDQRQARCFNRRLSRYRIVVEHTFEHTKTYHAMGNIRRHPGCVQPAVVELATISAKTRIVSFADTIG